MPSLQQIWHLMGVQFDIRVFVVKFSFPRSGNELFLKQVLNASEKTSVDNLFQKDALVRQSQV